MVADEVITTAELQPLIGTERIRIIDAREPDAYREGHIPGAVNLHPSALEHREILESGDEVDHQLNSLTEVATFFRAAGVSNSVPVCVYDAGGGYLAARLWWMLDYIGHPKCRLLDGGMFAWVSSGGRAGTESVPLAAGALTIRPNQPSRLEFSDVIATIGEPRTILCNTLPADRFRAEAIPGSINIPYTDTFAPDNHPLLKTRHELGAMFDGYGVTAKHRLICYCEIGYSACQVYFAARHAGFTDVAVYDGSVLDWVARGGGLEPGMGG